MTQNIAQLSWVDTTDNLAPVAPYTVNFGTDLTWRFVLLGSYHFQSIEARGVTIDNTLNAMGVTVTLGAYQVTIPAFQRIPVPLPRGSGIMTLQAPSAFVIGVEFWVNADLDIVSQFALQQAAVASNDWQKITQVAVSALASADLSLPTTFQRFRLTGQGIVFSNNATLFARFSSDGGVSFNAANYQWAAWFNDSAAGSVATGSAADTNINLSGGMTPAGQAFDVTAEIWPGSLGLRPTLRSHSYGFSATGNFLQGLISGGLAVAAVMNFLRVAVNAGTFSGTLLLEGFPT